MAHTELKYHKKGTKTMKKQYYKKIKVFWIIIPIIFLISIITSILLSLYGINFLKVLP